MTGTGETGQASDVRRPTGPGRAWYALAGLVAVGAVVVVGVLGVWRAFDLVGRMYDFPRFQAPGSSSLHVAEPGDHSVYYLEGGPGGDAAFTVTVTGPDGSRVSARPSDVEYGWGSRKAGEVAVFRATEPGEYLVEVDGDHGIMALGESLPGAPLYGFGPTMVVGFGFVVGSIVLAGVVASMRRRSSGRNGVGPQVIVVGGAVALVVGGAAVAVQGRADSTDRAANRGYGDDRADPEDLPDWMERCADPEYYQDNVDTGACGPTAEELHEMNMHYADRMGFEGDLAAANAIAEEVRNALRPIATGGPSADEVAQALAPWGPAIRTSTNAVGTSGTAFAVSVDGGCVFGSVHDGVVDVEVGGYINDGGCLAEYGH